MHNHPYTQKKTNFLLQFFPLRQTVNIFYKKWQPEQEASAANGKTAAQGILEAAQVIQNRDVTALYTM